MALCLWSEDIPSERTGFIGKAFDINESRLKREELEHQATHDTLTGLFNSTSAKERISKILKANPENKYIMAIFDLDTFKSINDTYGHLFGAGSLSRSRILFKRAPAETAFAQEWAGTNS